MDDENFSCADSLEGANSIRVVENEISIDIS